jgi:hypothetical protein
MKCLHAGTLLLLVSLFAIGSTAAKDDTFHVVSPDKKTDILVNTKGAITISVSRNGKEKTISGTDRLTVHLAPGGGWVARIKKTE